MRKVEEELPRAGSVVVAYCESGGLYIARYERVLTWTGRKYKFVNIQSRGMWHNDVIGWNRIPREEDTF